jgi:antitoxin HigA-1
MKKNGMRPVPPGEILNEEFLKSLGLTANALAKRSGCRLTGSRRF